MVKPQFQQARSTLTLHFCITVGDRHHLRKVNHCDILLIINLHTKLYAHFRYFANVFT